METPEPDPLSRLARYRAELFDFVEYLDQAIVECQETKRETLDVIGHLDRLLSRDSTP